MGQQSVSAWSARDSALWHTCEIAFDLARGVVPDPRQEVVAPFAPQLHPDERFWASGPFDLLEERAAGDGSYTHHSGLFFATGAVGLTVTAAVLGARAVGNANRRRAAAEAAVPRWTPVDGGVLHASAHGVTLLTQQAVSPWGWSGFTAMQVVGSGAVHLMGTSVSGPVSWVLRSDWAELVFVTWALHQHRRHPQLLDGGWLPPGWLAWAASQPYRTRLTSPVLGA